MICPEAGLWRAWLDDEAPAGETAGIEDHLAACPACRRTVDDLREGAAVTAGALASLAPAAEVPIPSAELIGQIFARGRSQAASSEPALAAQIAAAPAPLPAAPSLYPLPHTPAPAPGTPAQERRIMTLARTTNRWRVALGGLAAALALTFLIGTPEGRTATAQFLGQFRSQRFTVVTIDQSQRGDVLRQLERLGTVQGSGPGQSATTVGSIERASEIVGFPVKQPNPLSFPEGIGGTPKIEVAPATTMRFTFDKAKARAYFDSIGKPEVSLPDKFHGASLVVSVPAAVLLQYPDLSSTGPGLLIGQASELVVDTEGGVTLDEMRDFLLGLPGVSPQLAQQLRAIKDWRQTLPLPVPADKVNWQPDTIAGVQGLIIADNTGLGSGAIWQHEGRVYGVAGSAKIGDIKSVANSLK